MKKITEQPSPYRHLEQQPVEQLLEWINDEDQSVPRTIRPLIPKIAALIRTITDRMLSGGRLFYLGAGTSGRLAIVDASECPPTFGVEHGLVIGLMAGGDAAMRKAVEFAEDDPQQGWKDLQQHDVNHHDTVIGIAASGTTPYVVGALEWCNDHHITTGCITCNPGTPLARAARYPLEVVTGPEIVTGSTRMKAGTAQKLMLNMISTGVMIQLGRVEDNKMVDMQLTNNKLVERGTKMVAEALNIAHDHARKLLARHGSVRKAIAAGNENG
jgi:N-acetylmuramic acid 6-phosphate etherase